MIVHLDGDVLVYRAGFAAEHTFWKVEWNGYSREFESRSLLNTFLEEQGIGKLECVITSRVEAEPEGHALFNARSLVRSVEEKLQADELILYLSGPTNFRDGIATLRPYKGNRDPAHKPVHAAAIKAMYRREYNVKTSDGQEADDDMAMAHYALWLRDPYSTVIATIDKDLDMIPGLHYNFVKDKTYEIEPMEGIKNFYSQMLKGDTVDNIPGVPGIGPAGASKALAECKTEWEMYQAVLALYVQSYGDTAHDALLENGRLLWMRRHENEWWSPPQGEPTNGS